MIVCSSFLLCVFSSIETPRSEVTLPEERHGGTVCLANLFGYKCLFQFYILLSFKCLFLWFKISHLTYIKESSLTDCGILV